MLMPVDARPLLLSAENVVHQVAEFVKESFHVAVIHQARIASRGHRKIADQNGFRQLLATDTVKNGSHFRVAELSRTRVHVEIETPDGLSAVNHNPGLDRRIPRRHILLLLEADVKKIGSCVQNSLLHLHEGKIRAHRLGIELIFRAAN